MDEYLLYLIPSLRDMFLIGSAMCFFGIIGVIALMSNNLDEDKEDTYKEVLIGLLIAIIVMVVAVTLIPDKETMGRIIGTSNNL